MRYLTFLSANRQLTKTYYADGSSDPYPLVGEFTSFVVQYENLGEFFDALQIAGDAGACLLKGHLTKELHNESRAGRTDNSALTDFLVIDYDSDGGFDSFHELLREIDPRLAATDHIFQHSASAGIKGPAGLRGHAFFLLTDPVSPTILKQWLKKINLTSEKFKARIRLSRNAMALCYALDITVNQNDKLIYIAKPNLNGIEDPLPQRFELHRGSQRTYTFNTAVSAEYNRTKEHEHLEMLQDAAGLPKRSPRYKTLGDGEILINPAACAVTGVKDCGKYVRINLNGGDSWAYWYFKENPEILYNYKGEPNVYLNDVAPEYYAQIQRVAQAKTHRPFVFRDMTSDCYYAAEFDDATQRLISCNRVGKRQTLNDFMIQRGHPAPRVVQDWNIVFDPSKAEPVNFTEKRLNLFRPGECLEAVIQGKDLPPAQPSDFPTIEKTIRHICVDNLTYEHFMDWLAHIVQTRKKTETAWIFSGSEGTGKGTLFHKILKPIIGHNHCELLMQDQVDDQFNGYLQQNIILFLDEGDIENSRAADRMLAKFRTLITDPVIPIRLMRANAFQAPNYSNLIIATNQNVPIRLTASDRRYNVAPRQNQRLLFAEGEYEKIDDELLAFTAFLSRRTITERTASRVLANEARDTLMELSRTVAEDFFLSLKAGNLDFFTERLLEEPPFPDNGYIAFARIVRQWMETAGQEIHIPLDDMLSVYKYIGGNNTITPKRFGHAASRHNMKSERVRVQGIQRQVFTLRFEYRDYSEWLGRTTAPDKKSWASSHLPQTESIN